MTAVRALLLAVTIAVTGLSSGQPRFSEARELAPELLMPATLRSSEVAAAATRDGYVIAWIDDGAVRAVRINPAGELIDPLPKALGGSLAASNLVIASDGTDVLVGWTLAGLSATGADSTFRLAVLEGGSRHAVTQRGIGSLDALIHTGTRYLAVVGGVVDHAEIVELDPRGFTVASTSLGISAAAGDPKPWPSGFFVDRGVTWLVTTVNGRPMRAAVTDADGKPQRPLLEPLPFEVPLDHRYRLFSAGQVNGHWYVVYGHDGRHFVRFLDAEAPIAIGGFSEIAHRATRVSGNELYLFGLALGEERSVLRGARVSPDGRVRSFEIASGTRSWAIGSVAIPRGVLLVTANATSAAATPSAPPAARMIRTLLPRSLRTYVGPPVIMAWAPASQFEVVVAAHGAGFVAAWQQPSVEGIEVWSRLLDRDGKAVGEARLIGRGTTTKIASNGHVALVVSSNNGLVEARRLDIAGVPLGETIAIDDASRAIIGVGWDGMQFAMAWATSTDISTTGISAGGELLAAEPVRLAEPPAASWSTASFAVSPFGALLIYGGPQDQIGGRNTMAVRLARDLRAAGPAFEVVSIPTLSRRVVWTGQHYVVTVTQASSFRGARVSASGESIDAPYGIWLAQGGHEHRSAYANGRLLVIHATGGFIIDRELAGPAALLEHTALPYDLGTLAMREDGAALFGYARWANTRFVAVVKALD